MSDKKDNEDLAKAIVKDKNKDFDKGLARAIVKRWNQTLNNENLKEFNKVIETEKFIKIPNKNIIYIGALGYDVEEGDLSIHQFILDADLKIEQHNIMPVGERVRDMIYIEELNKIFLFLETSGSIGMLEVDN